MLISYLRADTHIAVKGVINFIIIFLSFPFRQRRRHRRLHCFQLRRNIFFHSRCRTNIAGDVIAAKHLVDQDVVGIRYRGIGLAVDMDKGVAAHIGHTGAAEHLALRICQRSRCLIVENGADVAGFHRHFR